MYCLPHALSRLKYLSLGSRSTRCRGAIWHNIEHTHARVLVLLACAAAVTLVLGFFCKEVLGMLVDAEAEEAGLDYVVHNQRAYDLES